MIQTLDFIDRLYLQKSFLFRKPIIRNQAIMICRQSCAIGLTGRNNGSLIVQLEGVFYKKEQLCFITAGDIARIKQVEEILRKRNH